MIEQPIHWARGGSNSDRILACPGSVAMNQAYPSDPSSPAAIDGTHSHTLLDHAVGYNLTDANLLVGKELEDHEGSFVVDYDRAARVNIALRYVMNKRREDPCIQIVSEKFVDAGQRWGIPEWGGSADLILFNDREYFEIIDYKDGGRPVNPGTYQMVTYGVGAQNEIQQVMGRPVMCTIVQPKVSKAPKTVHYTFEEFTFKAEELALAMQESVNPNAPRYSGKHCKWCAGAKPGRCPEFNQGATQTINEIFAGVPMPATPPKFMPPPQAAQSPSPVPTQPVLPNQAPPLALPSVDENITDEQLAQLLDAKPLVLELLKEAETEAVKRAQGGHSIPGYKLGRAVTRRKWTTDALDRLSKMRVKKEVYLDYKLRSPKAVLEAAEDLSETQRKKIQELVVKPEGAVTLIPESDPRPALTVDTREVFKDVPTQQPQKPTIDFFGA